MIEIITKYVASFKDVILNNFKNATTRSTAEMSEINHGYYKLFKYHHLIK